MKKLLVLTGALLVLGASVASAQINFAWRNCIAITAGAQSAQQNITYACDGSAAAPFKGVISFIAPQFVSHFVACDAILDIQTANATLPDFWRLGVGECRDGSFSYPVSLSGIGNTGSCRNPYAGANAGGGFQYSSGVTGPSRARVQLTEARDTEFALVAGAQYIAGMFTMDLIKDTDLGDGVCDGCLVPACLVVNQINVLQSAGQIPPSLDQNTLTTAATRQFVTWQGGAVGGSGCPAETPTKNKTWGSVKALYR